MQCNQAFCSAFPNYGQYGQLYPCNTAMPFPGPGPEVVGEGEVTTVLMPDGSTQLYFTATSKWGHSLYAGNCCNPCMPNLGVWFVRSVSNPIPHPTLQQNYPFLCGLPVPKTNVNRNRLTNCCNAERLKFHNDGWTSTTDLRHFFPRTRTCTMKPTTNTGVQVCAAVNNTSTICYCPPSHVYCEPYNYPHIGRPLQPIYEQNFPTPMMRFPEAPKTCLDQEMCKLSLKNINQQNYYNQEKPICNDVEMRECDGTEEKGKIFENLREQDKEREDNEMKNKSKVKASQKGKKKLNLKKVKRNKSAHKCQKCKPISQEEGSSSTTTDDNLIANQNWHESSDKKSDQLSTQADESNQQTQMGDDNNVNEKDNDKKTSKKENKQPNNKISNKEQNEGSNKGLKDDAKKKSDGDNTIDTNKPLTKDSSNGTEASPSKQTSNKRLNLKKTPSSDRQEDNKDTNIKSEQTTASTTKQSQAVEQCLLSFFQNTSTECDSYITPPNNTTSEDVKAMNTKESNKYVLGETAEFIDRVQSHHKSDHEQNQAEVDKFKTHLTEPPKVESREKVAFLKKVTKFYENNKKLQKAKRRALMRSNKQNDKEETQSEVNDGNVSKLRKSAKERVKDNLQENRNKNDTSRKQDLISISTSSDSSYTSCDTDDTSEIIANDKSIACCRSIIGTDRSVSIPSIFGLHIVHLKKTIACGQSCMVSDVPNIPLGNVANDNKDNGASESENKSNQRLEAARASCKQMFDGVQREDGDRPSVRIIYKDDIMNSQISSEQLCICEDVDIKGIQKVLDCRKPRLSAKISHKIIETLYKPPGIKPRASPDTDSYELQLWFPRKKSVSSLFAECSTETVCSCYSGLVKPIPTKTSQ